MGDRTTVTLTVPRCCSGTVEKIADGMYHIDDYEHHKIKEDVNGSLVDFEISIFVFDEVNYGDLQFLYLLQKEGIPYHSASGAGSSYEESDAYLRFTPEGEIVLKTLNTYSDFVGLNELQRAAASHEELLEIINEAQEARTILPWSNQVTYGQRYKAKQLITA